MYYIPKTNNTTYATKEDLILISNKSLIDANANFQKLVRFADDVFTLQDHIKNINYQVLPTNVVVFNPYQLTNIENSSNMFIEFTDLTDGKLVIAYNTYPLFNSRPTGTIIFDAANKAVSGYYATITGTTTITGTVRIDWTTQDDIVWERADFGYHVINLNKYLYFDNNYYSVSRGYSNQYLGAGYVNFSYFSLPSGLKISFSGDGVASWTIFENICGQKNTINKLQGNVQGNIRYGGAGVLIRYSYGDWAALRRDGVTAFSTYPSAVRTLETCYITYKLSSLDKSILVVYALFDLTTGSETIEISSDDITYTTITADYTDTTINIRGTAKFYIEDINTTEVFIRINLNGTLGTSAKLLKFAAMVI